MKRLDRLISVLTTLQTRKFSSIAYLCERFGISERTIYRDLRALSETGVPISFEADRGYFILKEFFLPPVTLSLEEANAIILLSALSAKYADASTRINIESGLDKIKSVLPQTHQENADAMQSSIRIYLPPDSIEPSDYLTIIQNSIIHKTQLRIEYKNNKEEISDRVIEVIGISFYSDQWHIIAWCRLRKNYRDFKVNSILALQDLKTPFEKTEHWDLNRYIRELQSVS
ncbi:MAG: WYL domain-containing protein [Bacteroidetes bacterium]|nr:WYL domain-containing protein [Bacteroidota bacterium]